MANEWTRNVLREREREGWLWIALHRTHTPSQASTGHVQIIIIARLTLSFLDWARAASAFRHIEAKQSLAAVAYYLLLWPWSTGAILQEFISTISGSVHRVQGNCTAILHKCEHYLSFRTHTASPVVSTLSPPNSQFICLNLDRSWAYSLLCFCSSEWKFLAHHATCSRANKQANSSHCTNTHSLSELTNGPNLVLGNIRAE